LNADKMTGGGRTVIMKILITTDLFTTATNGVVTSVRNLWDELKKKGHDVRILTFSEKRTSYRDGAVYYIKSVPFAIYPDVRMPVSYRNEYVDELIKWKPDVIHSQCEFFSFYFARRISKKTGAPIVHTYHTLYEQYVTYVLPIRSLGEYLVRVISRNRLKQTSRVIAPTRKVENTLRGYGIRSTICVVPSGISLQQHQQRITAEQRIEGRRAWGIGDDQKVMINLGRLGTEKNLEELVKMFAVAVSRDNSLRFLIVGDGPARGPLEKLSAELNIQQYVIFTGMVDPTKVQEYYQLGDIFVSASTSETQGLTYVEASANGLPLLCRQDDCLLDVLCPGENGYSYTNEEEFLDRLKEMTADVTWCQQAGERSEEIAVSFSKEAFGNAVEAVYLSALQD